MLKTHLHLGFAFEFRWVLLSYFWCSWLTYWELLSLLHYDMFSNTFAINFCICIVVVVFPFCCSYCVAGCVCDCRCGCGLCLMLLGGGGVFTFIYWCWCCGSLLFAAIVCCCYLLVLIAACLPACLSACLSAYVPVSACLPTASTVACDDVTCRCIQYCNMCTSTVISLWNIIQTQYFI